MTTALPQDLLELLRRPSPCFVTTLMPDGSPQTTQTWVDTDGEHVMLNLKADTQKVRNLARDPRITVAVADPDLPQRYYAVRGRVAATTTDGAAENIDELSRKYTGQTYAEFRGVTDARLLVTIHAHSIHSPTYA